LRIALPKAVSSGMQPFRKLLVWQKADALSARIDDLCDAIARKDRTLAKQLRDAAASIAATIAEGAGRATRRDFAHFVSEAIGSCNEVENHLHRSLRRKLITIEQHDAHLDPTVEVRKMAFGLRKRLLEADD